MQQATRCSNFTASACTVEGCGQPSWSAGLCQAHYRYHLRRHGSSGTRECRNGAGTPNGHCYNQRFVGHVPERAGALRVTELSRRPLALGVSQSRLRVPVLRAQSACRPLARARHRPRRLAESSGRRATAGALRGFRRRRLRRGRPEKRQCGLHPMAVRTRSMTRSIDHLHHHVIDHLLHHVLHVPHVGLHALIVLVLPDMHDVHILSP